MTISPFEFINQYLGNRTKYAIPDFQRSFSWNDYNKIEDLFDSIFRNYPLPRFFTWTVGTQAMPPMILYKFCENFNVNNPSSIIFQNNEYQIGPNNGHIAICDGQQRLSALIIGLLGKEFKSNKCLYFNVLQETDEEGDTKRFLFIQDDKVAKNNLKNGTLYIKVSRIYNYYQQQRALNLTINQIITDLINANTTDLQITGDSNQIARANLYDFISNFNRGSLDFVDICNVIPTQGIMEATEFFKRLNSGGKNLSKNDILFSIVSNYFPAGLKNEFDRLKDTYNSHQGEYPKGINSDFFLRVCLYILNNNVLYNVNNFNNNLYQGVTNNWDSIKLSIEKSLNLVRELNISPLILSTNSLIPVIFHFYKRGNQYNPSNDEKYQMIKYIIRSNLTKAFGSQGNQILEAIKRNQIVNYNNINYCFNFDDLNQNIPTQKTLTLNRNSEVFKELTELKYGDKRIKPILQILHNSLDSYYNYEIDHIHPSSICNSRNQLILNNVHLGDLTFISEKFNCLANLQLIPANCNNQKKDLAICEWLINVINQGNNNGLVCTNGHNDLRTYFNSNLIQIPDNIEPEVYMSLCNFREFYTSRKELITNMLANILCV